MPPPTGVTAANGGNPGEAVISWPPVAGAAFYRIAWIAAADAAAIAETGGAWLSAITFTAVAADPNNAAADPQRHTHTLTRLNPGVRYIFLVGSARAKASAPSWSSPTELYLTMGTLARDQSSQVTVPVGLLANAPGAFGGYTLFSAGRSKTTYLIDSAGQLVQRWNTPRIQDPRLLPNGNLMGRVNSEIHKVDPDGNILWSYLHSDQIHHDFVPLPNGNVLLMLRETKTPAEVIAAGANPAFVHENGLLIETIIEVRPIYPDRAAIVWKWSVWDHLIQDYDPAKANYGNVAAHPELVDLNYNLRQLSRTTRDQPTDWLHANGLDYNPKLDQILISARNFSEIWIIDHSTTTAEAARHSGGGSGQGGDLLYRWGNPQAHRAGTFADQQLFWQHRPTWIPADLPGAGNILIFNNGDEFEGRYLDYSSVVEITPPTAGYRYSLNAGAGSRYGPAQPTWTYTAANPSDFLSHRISGAQRLPNGNTMIVSGLQGVIFEVTPAGAAVWRYVNPAARLGIIYQGDPLPVLFWAGAVPKQDNALYRAYRYPPDYPGLQHYDLTPQGPIERYHDGAD